MFRIDLDKPRKSCDTFIKRHLRLQCHLTKDLGCSACCLSPLPGVSALLFEASVVTETQLALSNSWRSSVANIRAMELTIIDSHFFLAMGNLRSKNFEISLELQSKLSKYCP